MVQEVPHWGLWIPKQATQRLLQERGWSTLDKVGRKALALRWVLDSLPPGSSPQSADEGGHPPEVAVESGTIPVRIWLITRYTTVGGACGAFQNGWIGGR